MNQLTSANPPGWYECTSLQNKRRLTRHWDGARLRACPDDPFCMPASKYAAFVGPLVPVQAARMAVERALSERKRPSLFRRFVNLFRRQHG